MARVAGRFDGDRLAIDAGRQRAFPLKHVEDGVEMGGEAGVQGHIRSVMVRERCGLAEHAQELKTESVRRRPGGAGLGYGG